MGNRPKVVISDRIRFAKGLLPAKRMRKRYDRVVYNDSKCDKCDNLEERHNEICDECPAFIGRYRFFSKQELANGIWSVPQGDALAVVKTLRNEYGDDLRVIDKRKHIPFDHKIKFTGKLYAEGDVDDDGRPRADQVGMVEKWFKKGTGALRAAARSGKTVVCTAIYCRNAEKTVIIANQYEFLKQFYETATGREPPVWRGNKVIRRGKKAQRRRAVTNIRKLQRLTGKEIIRLVDKVGHLEKAEESYDILLMTYQALLRDPQRVLKYINGKFSLLVVDEQHRGSAHGYMTILAQINVAARLSVTATDKRKDSRDKFGAIIMGPVVASSNAVAMVPQITYVPTGIELNPSPKMWTTAMKRICYDKKRNRLIVDKIFADLKAGHKVILVPLDYIEHVEGLTRMINQRARKLNRTKDEDWPLQLARAYHARARNRSEVVSWVDSTEWDVPNEGISEKKRGPAPRVLVARASMIQEGIDWARPTCIHITIPMSGNARAGAPRLYQMLNRVCTPIAGKRTPVVRMYVDGVNMFKSALSGAFWHEIYAKSNLVNKQNPRYFLGTGEVARVKALLSKKDKNTTGRGISSGSWV